MKNALSLLLVIFIISHPLTSACQSNMPLYPNVITQFWTNYSYKAGQPYHLLYFAKKKDGWYVQIVDYYNDEKLTREQLFWSNAENKYKTLSGFGLALPSHEVVTEIDRVIRESSYQRYGYERCRYYGYNEWDRDMIRNFGNSIPLNDTLAEGLARAYANYGERYLWNGFGGSPFDDDPLKSRLGKLEIPSKERIDYFIAYTNKAIECYTAIARRNPMYPTVVGNIGMKTINEQFHQYQQLMICGMTKEADSILTKINPNDDVYRKTGHIYLDNCPPNSILITYGDNDTYAPWYVQEKDGYRKDVTVVNLSLLSFPPYVKMLKKTNKITFTTDPSSFPKIGLDLFTYKEADNIGKNDSIPLKDFLQIIQTVKYPKGGQKDTIATYPFKHIFLNIDVDRLKKFCKQENLLSSFPMDLLDYMTFDRLVIMDILHENLYTRPICCTAELDYFRPSFWQQQGSVYRLLPIDENLNAVNIFQEIEKVENYMKNYKPLFIKASGNSYTQPAVELHNSLFGSLIKNYLSITDTTHAKQWGRKYLSYPEIKFAKPGFGNITMGELLLSAGFKKEGTSLIERFGTYSYARYKNYSALDPWFTHSSLSHLLDYLKETLDKFDVSSKALNNAIDQLQKD